MNEQQRLDAAEYVLGTLDTDARVALERALLTDRKLAREKKGGQLCMEINNLVASTLDMALSRSKDTTGLTVLSDQGWHYKMQPYRAMFTHRGVTQNMSRKGNCFDNAVIESFLGTLKAVYFHLAKLDGLHDLEAGVNDYIHFYNHQRIKLGLKGLSPVEYRLRNTASSARSSSSTSGDQFKLGAIHSLLEVCWRVTLTGYTMFSMSEAACAQR